MKKIILLLFITILSAIIYGFYIKSNGEELRGDQIIGVAVIAIAFVFMPLFIFYRGKGKKMKDYMLTQENLDKMRSKNTKNSKKE